MPFFGPQNSTGGTFMDRLFGPGNAGNAATPARPSPTTAVAEQTGATASSPFLQYLQKNAPAAKSTARALLGEAPKADNKLNWAMLGASILGQEPGGAPLAAIGRGAAQALPYFMQTKEKQADYESQVQNLAMKLGMKDFELSQKMDEGTGLEKVGDQIIHVPTFKREIAAGRSVEEAFNSSIVIADRGAPEKNATALARMRVELEQLKSMGADPEKIQQKQDEIQAMEWQLKPEPKSSQVQFFGQDDDGNFISVTGSPGEVAGTIKTIEDEKTWRDLKTKQKSTDDVLGYASRIIDISENASKYAQGRLGGLASSVGAWGKAITEGLDGPRSEQFRKEVGDNPMAKLQELRNDPEAENYMDPALYEKLSQIGQENTQLLSNIIGLGYATARASDEGGRLSNSDVAFALKRVGYNLDAYLNDPAAVKAGVLELAGDAVRRYESSLVYEDPALLENDKLLGQRLKEYGFEWTGGPKGQLRYPGGQTQSQNSDQQQQQTDGQGQQPAPQQPPQVNTEAEYNALQPGQRYVAPDGSIRVKGGR